MSMKRSKQSGSGSKRYSDGDAFSFNPRVPEEIKTWTEYMEGKLDDAFAPYSIKADLAKGALVAHKTFGKGIVIGSQETRVEVLFEQGVKTLAHRQN